MIRFAQPADLVPDWLPDVPDNAASLIRYASILVARACEISLYDPQPAEPAASVLRDATCAQVASWAAQGVDPAKAGTDMLGPVKAADILDGSYTRDTSAAIAAMADARDGLCSIATDLLQTAGLLYVPVPLFDNSGYLPSYGLDSPWTEPPTRLQPTTYPPGVTDLLLAELDSRFDSVPTLAEIQEILMGFSPLTADPTVINGAPVVIASSTTSVALTLGRQHLVTGSAAQPVTVPTPTVNGTVIGIKVADGSTASVTLPAALQMSGVTSMSAGQDYDWFWNSATSTWSIE